jgi:hypothetical protein
MGGALITKKPMKLSWWKFKNSTEAAAATMILRMEFGAKPEPIHHPLPQ